MGQQVVIGARGLMVELFDVLEKQGVWLNTSYWLNHSVAVYIDYYTPWSSKQALHIVSRDGLKLVIMLDDPRNFYVTGVNECSCSCGE